MGPLSHPRRWSRRSRKRGRRRRALINRTALSSDPRLNLALLSGFPSPRRAAGDLDVECRSWEVVTDRLSVCGRHNSGQSSSFQWNCPLCFDRSLHLPAQRLCLSNWGPARAERPDMVMGTARHHILYTPRESSTPGTATCGLTRRTETLRTGRKSRRIAPATSSATASSSCRGGPSTMSFTVLRAGGLL